MILGGGLVFFIGVFGLMRYLTPLFTDRVVGVILLLIALTLLPFVAPMLIGADDATPHGRPLILLLALFMLCVFVLLSSRLKGRAGTISLFIGISIGTVLFFMFAWWIPKKFTRRPG